MGRMPENQLVTAVLLPMMSALLAMHSVGFIHRYEAWAVSYRARAGAAYL